MDKLVDRFRKWVSKNHPDASDILVGGVEEADLKMIEDALKLSLPEDFKVFLRIIGKCTEEPIFLDGWRLMDPETMIKENKEWTARDDDGDDKDEGKEKVKLAKYFNDKWIPFAADDAADFYCLDLDPGESGTVGQVIAFYNDGVERPVLAESFGKFMEEYVDGLEKGRYRYSKGNLFFVDTEMYGVDSDDEDDDGGEDYQEEEEQGVEKGEAEQEEEKPNPPSKKSRNV